MAGLCFGVAYGITQRLVSLNVGELIRFGQRFDVQVFPGTSLDSLRLRFGAAESALGGGAELPPLDRRDRPSPVDAEPDPQADGGADAPAEPGAPAAPDLPGADAGVEPETSPPPAPSGPPPAPLAPPAPVASPARP